MLFVARGGECVVKVKEKQSLIHCVYTFIVINFSTFTINRFVTWGKMSMQKVANLKLQPRQNWMKFSPRYLKILKQSCIKTSPSLSRQIY